MGEMQAFVNQAKLSAQKILSVMADLQAGFDEPPLPGENEIEAYGISSIISFTGKIKGRILIDMEHQLALHLARMITGDDYPTAYNEMVLETVAELNNTISGDLVTNLNNNHGLKLWLSPPIVFIGEQVVIAVTRLTSTSLLCRTEHGKLLFNIALEGVS